jgi:hypothetical protein
LAVGRSVPSRDGGDDRVVSRFAAAAYVSCCTTGTDRFCRSRCVLRSVCCVLPRPAFCADRANAVPASPELELAVNLYDTRDKIRRFRPNRFCIVAENRWRVRPDDGFPLDQELWRRPPQSEAMTVGPDAEILTMGAQVQRLSSPGTDDRFLGLLRGVSFATAPPREAVDHLRRLVGKALGVLGYAAAANSLAVPASPALQRQLRQEATDCGMSLAEWAVIKLESGPPRSPASPWAYMPITDRWRTRC